MLTVEFIRPLERVGPQDLLLAGGKAVSLGQMVRAGLPVPRGFVLLTSAYQEFVQSNGFGPQMAALLEKARVEDQASVERVSDDLRQLFDRGALPETVVQELAQAYRDLGEGRVAVRSSATAEDLPGASFMPVMRRR